MKAKKKHTIKNEPIKKESVKIVPVKKEPIKSTLLMTGFLAMVAFIYFIYSMRSEKVIFFISLFILVNLIVAFAVFFFTVYAKAREFKLTLEPYKAYLYDFLTLSGLIGIIVLGFSLYHNRMYVFSAVVLLTGICFFMVYSSLNSGKDQIYKHAGGGIAADYPALLAFAAGLIMFWWAIGFFKTDDIRSGVICFTAAVMLSLGFFKLFEGYHTASPVETGQFKKHYDLLIAVAIGVLAFVIRSFYLSEVPGGLATDEDLMIQFTARLLAGEKMPAYFSEPTANQASLVFYIVVFFYKLLGFSTMASRMPSVVASSLSVVLIYYLAKSFFSRRVAVISSLLTAFMFIDILYARINIGFSLVTLFALLTVYLFFRGESGGLKKWFILSGASLGITLYFYNAAKLLPIIFILYFLYRLAVSKSSREDLFKKIPSYALFVLSAIVVFSPILIFIIQHPDVYFIRLKSTSYNITFQSFQSIQEVLFAVFRTAAGYFQALIARGGLSGQWNIPMKPYFDFLTAFFFLTGLGYLISDFKNKKNIFLLIWFIAGMSGGFLSVTAEGTTGHRITLAFACFGIIAALGLDKSLNVLKYLNNEKIIKPVRAVVITVVLFFVAYTNLYNYFHVYKNDAAMRFDRKPYNGEMLRTLKELKLKKAYFSNYYQAGNVTDTIAMEFRDAKVTPYYVNVPALGFNEIQSGKEPYFALAGEGLFNKSLDFYHEYYPNAVVKKNWNYDYLLFDDNSTYRKMMGWDNPDQVVKYLRSRWDCTVIDKSAYYLNYVLCLIPALDIAKAATVSALFYKYGALTDNVQNCPVPLENINGSESVTLSGLIYMPEYGAYKIEILDAVSAVVYVDGVRVAGKKILYRGLHRFKAVIDCFPDKVPVIAWQKPGQDKPGAIEKEYFVNSDKLFGLLCSYYDKTGIVYSQLETLPVKRVYYFSREPILQAKNADINKMTWTGGILIKEPGKYAFLVENQVTDSAVAIDGKIVFKKTGDKTEQVPIFLSAGRHDLNTVITVTQALLHTSTIRFKMKHEKWNLYWEPDYTCFER